MWVVWGDMGDSMKERREKIGRGNSKERKKIRVEIKKKSSFKKIGWKEKIATNISSFLQETKDLLGFSLVFVLFLKKKTTFGTFWDNFSFCFFTFKPIQDVSASLLLNVICFRVTIHHKYFEHVSDCFKDQICCEHLNLALLTFHIVFWHYIFT